MYPGRQGGGRKAFIASCQDESGRSKTVGRVMLHGLMEGGKQTMRERDGDGRRGGGGGGSHCWRTAWQMAAAAKARVRNGVAGLEDKGRRKAFPRTARSRRD